MNRNTILRASLCLVLMATVGTGALNANAKDDTNPSQAGQSSIYFYDVAASDSHGKGRLVIDLDKHTFVFNGQDFTPSARIELRARAEGSTDHIVFASGQATPSGNLHIAGSWERPVAPLAVASGYVGISAFSLYNDGWFVARLACYYSTDNGVTWTESGHTGDITKCFGKSSGVLSNLGVPSGALVKIHAIVVGGKDRTGSEVWQYVGYYNEIQALYNITGTTWNPTLDYFELGFYWD